MMHDFLTEDTKATLLLCGVFGREPSEKPLALTEYSLLVRWLIDAKIRPGDLLQKNVVIAASLGTGLSQHRLESLIARGVYLGFAVEEWQRNGIWVISRSDADYPVRYKKHLKDKAPPLLFGAGDRSLLSGGGLGIVGSRNVDGEGAIFSRLVGELCACNHMPVVSGGARGVDQISMSSALDAGGIVIGVLAENLLRKSIERSARMAIAEKRLLLVSPCHPTARFTVGTAMGRNKLIYALADYTLVVSAEHKKGGTWAGAEEELKRDNSLPVFVRDGSSVPLGNRKLLSLGALPWPSLIDHYNLQQQLHDLAVNSASQSQRRLDLLDVEIPKVTSSIEKISSGEEVKEKRPEKYKEDDVVSSELDMPENKSSIYHAVLPLILKYLTTPTTVDDLSAALNVNKAQLSIWLKQAVEEKKIIKLTRPLRFQKADAGVQALLWQ